MPEDKLNPPECFFQHGLDVGHVCEGVRRDVTTLGSRLLALPPTSGSAPPGSWPGSRGTTSSPWRSALHDVKGDGGVGTMEWTEQ